MPLPEDDRRALVARLAPNGGDIADAVANALESGEELREVVVDAQGDVVAFTDRRALFAAQGATDLMPFGYDEIQVRRRDAGLAIDALVEGGRLVLEVARATFVRLGVVAAGGPPGRASWLPDRAPKPRPSPPPTPLPLTEAEPGTRRIAPGWHPDPSGRHWWRWWDGVDWTSHVADGGPPSIDPLPPKPPPA
jgi:Protein of unknown function (DUF2510)